MASLTLCGLAACALVVLFVPLRAYNGLRFIDVLRAATTRQKEDQALTEAGEANMVALRGVLEQCQLRGWLDEGRVKPNVWRVTLEGRHLPTFVNGAMPLLRAEGFVSLRNRRCIVRLARDGARIDVIFTDVSLQRSSDNVGQRRHLKRSVRQAQRSLLKRRPKATFVVDEKLSTTDSG